jgi:hypothetical protein
VWRAWLWTEGGGGVVRLRVSWTRRRQRSRDGARVGRGLGGRVVVVRVAFSLVSCSSSTWGSNYRWALCVRSSLVAGARLLAAAVWVGEMPW